MATIKQVVDFPNSEAHASAFYANGKGVEAGSAVFAWAGTSATADGPGLQAVWSSFQTRLLDGAWGAGFSYNGQIMPNAVVLRSGVILNATGLYILWIIFAATPSASFTTF